MVYIPVQYDLEVLILSYRYDPVQNIPASIQSISRSKDGTVQSITTWSQDRLTEFRHRIDTTPSTTLETSMVPFLDNKHVLESMTTKKKHKFRVQFKGSHITKTKYCGQTASEVPRPPIYLFRNEEGEDRSHF